MIRDKILAREALAPRVEQWRAEGKRVGLTNGVFDILHAGHLEYIEEARRRCDVLIVSLNTDRSVAEYKDPGRPLIGQEDRAFAVAALQCVDWVTFHDERRMRTTLEIIKPTYYIKGGDYSTAQLTSRDVVEKYGGEVLLIPLKPGYSTTAFIERVVERYGVNPVSHTLPSDGAPRPAVFLDRDGVLNEEVHFLKYPEEVRMVEGVAEGLRALREMNFQLVVVTNQAGIGLGYITEKDFLRCNSALLRQINAAGGVLDRFYYCPHSLSEDCPCRKPRPLMIQKAAAEMNLDLERSWIIGDRDTDIECGRNAGVRPILIHTGFLKESDPCVPEPDYRCADLREAARIIRAESSADRKKGQECPAPNQSQKD